jgi:hypothetical protein
VDSLPDPSDARLARFDQRRVAVPPDVEPQKIKAIGEGDDARLVLKSASVFFAKELDPDRTK